VLLRRHGGADFVASSGLLDTLEADVPDEDDDGKESTLAADLEARGPAYIKLGQLLATRADLLPPRVIADLSRLQDDLEPVPFDQIREVIEDELGVRLTKAFATFDEEPLATASLGQVHAATLRDGRAVAVKVQRPGIREQLRPDLEAFDELATFLEEHTEIGRLYRVTELVDQFRAALARELDYRREASNLNLLRTNLDDFDRLIVPGYVEDFTSGRVLTMERIEGRKVTEISPVRQLSLDADDLVDELFRAYLKQILVDGFVHADPHPGNVLLTDDDRLALLDLGMVLRVEPNMRKHLLRMVLAVSDHETEQAADAAIKLGTPREDFDLDEFRRRVADLVGTYHDLPPEDFQLGTILLEVARIAGDSGLKPPPELTLLARTLLALDQVGRALSPTFDVDGAVRRHSAELLTMTSLRELSPSRVLQPMLEAKEFAEELPRRANTVLDALANGTLKFQVDTFDEDRMMGSIQRLANRLTAGLVLAALIIGAAMLMRVETDAQILGYPALAIIFFLIAAAGGLVLAVTAFLDSR
jgi:predicted unusual protein kinase regulating ubiquinone biosynthesis (AarF/ABC1/UbiB family)